ncbi:MAG: hypothetical protein AAFR95_08375, partial [Bacteroidota bacterium]
DAVGGHVQCDALGNLKLKGEREQNEAVLELALTFQLQIAEGIALDVPTDGIEARRGSIALLGWAAGAPDEVFVPPRG